ncbi:hypothetical protein LPJ75_004286, partial [Coemansia sp. RSA 2598]
MAAAANASNVVHNEVGTGGGAGIGSPEQPSFADSSSLKRKQSAMFSTSGEIDLSMLPPPRAGRPLRSANTDPGMQEARKRARVLRNRAAAQLSREKKRMHLEQLEQENTELKAKNEELEERLSRAEESNKDLSARLDSLAKQMQSFQNLVLGAQQNQQCQAQALQAPQPSQAELQSSLASPAIDWSALTPLNASPLLQGCATPDRSNSTNTVLSYTSAPNTATTSIGTPLASPSSSLEIPMAAPQVSSSTFVATATLPSPASVEPTSATMELFSNTVAASSDLADKGLSESAALEQSGTRIYSEALVTYAEYLPQVAPAPVSVFGDGVGGGNSGSVGNLLLDQFINELGSADGQYGGNGSGLGIADDQPASTVDDILRFVVDSQPKWRFDQQAPALAHCAWDFGLSS